MLALAGPTGYLNKAVSGAMLPTGSDLRKKKNTGLERSGSTPPLSS